MTQGPPRVRKPLSRVVYVVSLFPCWSETFIVREIDALIESGVDVRIVSLKPASETLVQRDAAALLPRVHHPSSRFVTSLDFVRTLLADPILVTKAFAHVLFDSWRTPTVMLKSMAALMRGMEHVRWLRAFDPDIVYSHWATYPSTVAWALGRVLGKPFGFTSHAHDIFVERQLLARKLQDASLAVTISNYNRDWLSRRMPERSIRHLRVVHCGVDLANVPGRRGGALPGSILAVGRLHPIKGFDTLLDALALLRDRDVAFRCRLVGGGPLSTSLRRQAKRLRLDAHLEFTGARAQDDVRGWMQQSELFVLPSKIASDGNRDGIPVALMEAMASGCATVSTRVSGIPELIEDDVDGLLVEAADPVALADALERLLHDAELRARLSARARLRIELEFDSKKEAARLRDYMQEAAYAT